MLSLSVEFQSYASLDPSIFLKEEDSGASYSISISSTLLSHWSFNRSVCTRDWDASSRDASLAIGSNGPVNEATDGDYGSRLKLALNLPISIEALAPTPSKEMSITLQATTHDILALLARVYVGEDNELLLRLAGCLSSIPPNKPQLKSMLYYFVKNDLMAMCGLFSFPDLKAGWLGWAMVDPSKRGTGLHAEMLNHRISIACQQRLEHLFCEVVPGSSSQKNLMNFGFEPIFNTHYQMPNSI